MNQNILYPRQQSKTPKPSFELVELFQEDINHQIANAILEQQSQNQIPLATANVTKEEFGQKIHQLTEEMALQKYIVFIATPEDAPLFQEQATNAGLQEGREILVFPSQHVPPKTVTIIEDKNVRRGLLRQNGYI